jgi:hypothetical protein
MKTEYLGFVASIESNRSIDSSLHIRRNATLFFFCGSAAGVAVPGARFVDEE